MEYDLTLYNETEAFFTKVCGFKNVYIYGTGKKQLALERFLKICGKEIAGFAVTEKDNQQCINELNVFEIKDIAPHEDTAIILGLADRYFNEIWQDLRPFWQNIIFLSERAKSVIEYKTTPKLKPDVSIEVNLVTHCNLNCQMCDHFSQLSKPSFLDIGEFERDAVRLSELSNGEIGTLKLLGGEPLLHPELISFFEISRKLFPKATIKLYTNALLLPRDGGEIWDAARLFGITLVISCYPGLKIDTVKITETARKNNVVVIYESDTNKTRKISVKYTLSKKKNAPPYNFIECFQMNSCPVMQNGRIYACPMSACIGIFNEYFDEDFAAGGGDYIDIYAVKNFEEITNFLSTPVPFCGYCDIKHRSVHEWRTSKKVIEEYI